jgi:P27 family predicted phage terminase small subunit
MARGRKLKPLEIKVLNGNPGHRPLPIDSVKFQELESAVTPEWLDEMAKECWEWYSPLLLNQKILTRGDLHNLEAFCSAYSRWRQAEEQVKLLGVIYPDGHDGYKKNPACTVITEALSQLEKFGGLLGLDPASRQRLTAPKGKSSNPFLNL